ncbi:MAG TPA: glycerophosphodiester phosphodiesterase [Thermoanaerobaculaceae bacterium]|nr:glycerophosphodiester phosphodiesterase [Thermoanaerobaculaceae bacterium]
MELGTRTPDAGLLIIGHRGFAAAFPDNSLAGVQAAITAGADGVEVDVRRCADGTWVCHHDRTRAGRPVAAWALAELRRQGVPTLADVADAVPADRWLYVEVKPLPASDLRPGVPALAELLERRLAFSRVISSDGTVLAAVAGALPAVSRSLVFDVIPERLPADVELSPEHRLVESLVGRGRPLHPWTVDDAARMRELAALRVGSITTNDPVLALEVLRG